MQRNKSNSPHWSRVILPTSSGIIPKIRRLEQHLQLANNSPSRDRGKIVKPKTKPLRFVSSSKKRHHMILFYTYTCNMDNNKLTKSTASTAAHPATTASAPTTTTTTVPFDNKIPQSKVTAPPYFVRYQPYLNQCGQHACTCVVRALVLCT